MKRVLFILAVAILVIKETAQARPLLVEEVSTVGKKSFETTISFSHRIDQFNTAPQVTYETFQLPLTLRLGLSKSSEFGFDFQYIHQKLKQGSAEYSGSINGRFSPFVKIAPWKLLALKFLYHPSTPEETEQELQVATGEDFEAIALFQIPTKWPLTFNIGYLTRGRYNTKFGVQNGPIYGVDPGNIFESKLSLEVPLKFNLSLLTETAYYNSQDTYISNQQVPSSAAEAMDVLLGLNWAYKGWNIGSGVAWGLLEEKYTSFNLERGAGDVMYKLNIGYKLSPRNPTK
ncbi:MAG: hypothetical protein KCHDKBKB_02167 [Elusimicrobia bacterium]|nr:hypothetical protein [Elusimicrobiota bacterium]